MSAETKREAIVAELVAYGMDVQQATTVGAAIPGVPTVTERADRILNALAAEGPREIRVDFSEATVDMTAVEATNVIARAAGKLKHVNAIYDTLVQIANELQAWESSGTPRPASWATTRIARARAAIRVAEEVVSIEEVAK